MVITNLDFGRLELDEITNAVIINCENDINLDNIYIKNIFKHGLLFGYQIYELLEDHNRILGYGIQLNEFLAVFDKYFTKHTIRRNILYYVQDKIEYEFVRIDHKLIELIKSTEDKQYGSLPVAKMIIFDHDTEYIKSFVKRPEIYMISKIAIELANFCKIELQSNVLDYRIDGLFTITSLKCDNIDKIALEIDEDDHKSYNKEADKFRLDLLKAFKNKIVKVPVRRKASCVEMDEIIKTKVEEIKLAINDLIAQYSIDSISHDEFVKLLQKEMTIDMDFAKLFAKHNHPILDNYKYLHSEIANFLGYACDETGYCRTFTELIKKNLKIDVTYVMVAEDVQNPAELRRVLPDDKKGGRKQKIKYYLTRLGFYLICMCANTMKAKECKLQFGRVYEIALNYSNGLKHKIIESQTPPDVMKKLITQRLNDKVENKLSKKKESKLEVLYNNQLEEINELKQTIKSNDDENVKLHNIIAELQDKIKYKDNLLQQKEVKNKKINDFVTINQNKALIINDILKHNAIVSQRLKRFYRSFGYGRLR